MADVSELCQIGLVWLGLGIGALSSQHPLHPMSILGGDVVLGYFPAVWCRLSDLAQRRSQGSVNTVGPSWQLQLTGLCQ